MVMFSSLYFQRKREAVQRRPGETASVWDKALLPDTSHVAPTTATRRDPEAPLYPAQSAQYIAHAARVHEAGGRSE